jgi:hypothetical protein
MDRENVEFADYVRVLAHRTWLIVAGLRLDRPLRAVPVGMVLGLWGSVLLVFVLEYAQRWQHRTAPHGSVT